MGNTCPRFMDARTLKIELRADMLNQYQALFTNLDPDAQEEDMARIMGLERPLTQTQINRFERVMDQLVNEALRKAGYNV